MHKTTTAALAALAIPFAAFAADVMKTGWGEKVTAENAWRLYPRPQMVRDGWTCLNGEWDYAITKVAETYSMPKRWDGKILVPFCLESPLSGANGRLLEPTEYLWYRRKLTLDPKPGEKILLHFGSVDFRAIVYLGHDEVMATPHEGGQLPFTADLTPYAKKGENVLTVLVWDPTEANWQSRGKQAFHTHGCFYTRCSGIGQTVWLETVPERHIADYAVATDIDKGEVTLTFDVAGVSYADAGFFGPDKGSLEILDGGKCVACAKFLPGRPCTVKMPAGFGLWSPDSPKLYDFTAKFGGDQIKGYFGMRKFEKRKDAKGVLRFFLNNKPFYVMGTLDQGWWPDGLLTPPSEEAMAFDIKTLKDCGFNTMRKHIKVEPLRYYALCDRMGLVVLQDMPSSNGDARTPYICEVEKVQKRSYVRGALPGYSLYRQELKGMIDLLAKVPCIVMWIPYNEGWGQHDFNLTHTTLDFVRKYDPTRLVDAPSGWQDMEGGTLRVPKEFAGKIVSAHRPAGECEAGDVVDMHVYRGPGMPAVNPRRVAFLGEFGGLGLAIPGHLWNVYAQGVAAGVDKVKSWGYQGLITTREDLEKTYMELMEKLGGFAEKGLSGSIYTQTTDVELETNGLLTYDRKVLKYDAAKLKKVHSEIIERATKTASK